MSRDSTLASLSWETAAPDLGQAAELAGSALAHAVWCMSEEDEGPFAPTVAYEGVEGRRFLMFDDEDCDAAVARGQAWLAANPPGAAPGPLPGKKRTAAQRSRSARKAARTRARKA